MQFLKNPQKNSEGFTSRAGAHDGNHTAVAAANFTGKTSTLFPIRALGCVRVSTSLSFANSEFTFSNNLRLNSLVRIGFNGLAFLTASSRLIRRCVCICTRILTGGIGAPGRSEAVVLKVKLHGCVCRVQAPRAFPVILFLLTIDSFFQGHQVETRWDCGNWRGGRMITETHL